jgi:hypothetical protein
MNNQLPLIIWFIRVCLCAVCFYLGRYLLVSISTMSSIGMTVFGGFLLLGIIALVASFIRSKRSVSLLMLTIIVLPLFAFSGMDIFVLRNAWWANAVALPLQMAIPLVIAFYLWKAPTVRNYYSSQTRSRIS